MKYAVITDSHLAALYPPLSDFVVPAGESSKTLAMVETLASQMIQKGYGRDTTIVAVGGGVITDLAGCLASLFCRGVPLILVPTTLLAIVDASIGGKTGVNLREGKNLLGTFKFPEKVLLHLPFLETLPLAEWENGLVEIFKMGLIADRFLFLQGPTLSLETLIHRAIEAKRRIVAQDPEERTCRVLLNFGHTIGHALEACSAYTLPHGRAVAQGIVVEARLSHRMGLLPKEELALIESRFPFSLIPYPPNEVFQKFYADKKTVQRSPRFVLLQSIGVPYIAENRFCHTVDEKLLTEVLSESCVCTG